MTKLNDVNPIHREPMKFKEYCEVLGGVTVHFYFSESESLTQLLFEARHRGKPLGGPYSASFHKAHIPAGLDHLHVYVKQNELFAINRDGTAHDRSHGVEIPNRVADAIRDKYPDFTLPANNFIESAPTEIRFDLLLLG